MINLYSLAPLFIQLKSSFIDITRFLNINSPALSLATIYFPKIDLTIAFDELELRTINEFVDCEVILGK